jgi:hypothetical protein
MPARIEELTGQKLLPAPRQQALVSQLDHLLYSHMLQVGSLPWCCMRAPRPRWL